MKTSIFFKGLASVAVVLGLSACSSDYLDLEPEGTLMESKVTDNVQGLTLGVHGICNQMYKQYSSYYDYNWFNGEPWLSMYYGEIVGQDYISLFWFRGNNSMVVDWTQMAQHGSYGAAIAWSYCYGIINKANRLLGNDYQRDTDGFKPSTVAATPDEECTGELAFRKAQTLTMRAHAYLRLAQIYAPRWQDSNDGETLTVPLRLYVQDAEGNTDCPLSPMKDLMKLIYSDLDRAIDLYNASGMDRTYKWEPGLPIAQGLYARAAMLKEDFPTAQKMAHDARQGYPIMTLAEYKSGFADDNSEWMWISSDQPQGLYFASFGATYACNGAYPCGWQQIGAGAIDNDLITAIVKKYPADGRVPLYFSPSNLPSAKRASFWGGDCDATTLVINQRSGTVLSNEFTTFGTSRYNEIGKSRGWALPYTIWGAPTNATALIGYQVFAQFGAQFKFWGKDSYSSSYFPFMRGAEMLLIEAEAAYMNDDEKTAQNCLTELNNNRVINYRGCKTTGEKLLDEIKLDRRMELWGEGYSWFDFKRWNEPIVRSEWIQSNTKSGNWPRSVAGTYDVDRANGWRWAVPTLEYQYNAAVLNQLGLSGDKED